MQEIKTKYQTRETKDVEVSFTKEEQVTSDGRPFVVLDNEKYSISLFPLATKPAKGKQSYIKYNARVHFKNSGIQFHMAIREMVEDGSLIAGQQGRMSQHRAVVTEWNAEKGLSYERMAIPDNQYRELMAMVAEATREA